LSATTVNQPTPLAAVFQQCSAIIIDWAKAAHLLGLVHVGCRSPGS
jgi:hypothetical protein